MRGMVKGTLAVPGDNLVLLKEKKYIPYFPAKSTIEVYRERLSGLIGNVLAEE